LKNYSTKQAKSESGLGTVSAARGGEQAFHEIIFWKFPVFITENAILSVFLFREKQENI
jgi:hypothetical protein